MRAFPGGHVRVCVEFGANGSPADILILQGDDGAEAECRRLSEGRMNRRLALEAGARASVFRPFLVLLDHSGCPSMSNELYFGMGLGPYRTRSSKFFPFSTLADPRSFDRPLPILPY